MPPLHASFLIVLAALTAQQLRAADDKPNPTARQGAADYHPSPDHPAGWRGDGTGQYAPATPPTKWSAKENILWKTEVGAGSSAPVLAGNRIFVTAEPDLLVCVDADSGKELWRKAHKITDFPAAIEKQPNQRPNEYGDANPAPVSDGKSVWAFFGPGIVACYDMDGMTRWINWFDFRRNTQYARTASPVLIGDRLLVHFGPLVCLEASTGKVLWKNDSAKATYGTSALARIGDVDIIITPGGHAVRLTDGKTLASDLGHCTYTSPIVHGRIIYFMDKSISAIELPEKLPEKSTDEIEGKELWFEDLTGDFYSSPILLEGKIYTVDRSAELFIIESATGKTLSKTTLDLPPAGHTDSPNIYPSICLAGKHLFIGNDAGQTILLKPGDPPTQTASNTLPAGSGSTPIFAGKKMYIRGGKLLYCIGEQ